MASPTACTITSAGISAPSYQEIYDYLVAQYISIYGSDSYLGNDSQDGQYIGVIATGYNDANNATIAAYNSFSPATAQGVGLSSVVKINGLKRSIPSFSTAPLTLVGVANTTITNGQAADGSGNVWNLPTTVVIPFSGTVTVTATCTTAGAITAAPNTITSIQTAVLGWQTVTNPAAAAIGALVEPDAALRVRQSVSVSLPSVTIFEGIIAAIAQVVGVTRVKGYENNTDTTDANGITPHNLAFIVEGGSISDISNAIAAKIPPGIPTTGAINTTVVDNTGSLRVIKFSTPTDATFTIAITLKALAGWSVATEALIQASIVTFLETLPIGSNISFLNGLLQYATMFGTPYYGTFNITALTIQKNSASPVSADIQLAYNEAAVTAPANITFSVS